MNTHHRNLPAVFLSCALAAAAVPASGGNAPYDFSYRVTGSTSVRPSLVFNDGQDTYIQPLDPNAPVQVVGAKYARQGPYIVVFGLPKEFALVSKSLRADIIHQAAAVAEQGLSTVSAASAAPKGPASTLEKASAPTAAPADNSPFVTSAGPVAEKKSEPVEHKCRPRTAETIQTVAVQFGDGATRLSAAGRDQLESTSRATRPSKAVIHPPHAIAERYAARRLDEIRAALRVAGVESDQVEVGAQSAFGRMYAVDLIVRKEVPCTSEGLTIEKNGERFTVVGKDVPAERLVEEFADKAGLRYVQTGEPNKASVSPNIVAADMRTVLAKIGAELGEKATLVLRNHELLLSFEK